MRPRRPRQANPSAAPPPALAAAGVVLPAVLLVGSLTQVETVPWPVALVVLGLVVLVPGDLFLRCFGLDVGGGWLRLYLTVCCGLLQLMVVGLVINTVLPWVGIDRPLAPSRVLPALILLTGVTGYVAVRHRGARVPEFRIRAVLPRRRPSPGVMARYAVAALLPPAAAAGAFALNNGGPGGITVLLLLAAVLLFGYLAARADSLPPGYGCFAVYCVGLAFELMTSLRGWHTTGHDVQREFYVFQLTTARWRWDIGAFRDPYNACLSITILPTMLKGLLRVPDVSIYKFYFQVLFALVPVAVLQLGRKVAGGRVGVLAAAYFVAFPTYFSDMSMLNRQEIAFLLQGGMIILLVCLPGARRARQVLFLAFGVGTVLSHYSTTFLMLGQLLVASALLALWRLRAGRRAGRDAGWAADGRVLTMPLVIALAILTAGWTGPVTHTAGGAAGVAVEAARSLTGGGDQIQPEDTQSSLVNRANADPQRQVDEYALFTRESRLPGVEYFPAAVVDGYPLLAAADETTPATRLGRLLGRLGIAPHALNGALRGGSAVALQLLVLAGVVGLVLRWPLSLRAGREQVAMCVASLFYLGVLVLVPSLTAEYGLLRAFQQSLLVLATPVVLGGLVAAGFLRSRPRWVVGGSLPLVLAVSSTGLLAAVTGSYVPQLHLGNSGDYYENFLVHDTDLAAVEWLLRAQHGDPSAPRACAGPAALSGLPEPAADRLATVGCLQLMAKNDSAPALVPKRGFVYLDYARAVRHRAFGMMGGAGVRYRYPIDFLNDNKNCVYAGGGAVVYR